MNPLQMLQLQQLQARRYNEYDVPLFATLGIAAALLVGTILRLVAG